MTPERIRLGNLGDCRAILVSEGADGRLEALQLTHEHNARYLVECVL